MILYHATPKKNVESILAEGLRPPSGHAIVYLSHEPYSWKYEGDAVLCVDMTGLEDTLTNTGDGLDEELYWSSIPPERIGLMGGS